jgi:hypothetical protein
VTFQLLKPSTFILPSRHAQHRIETDIVELDVPDTTAVLPDQPTETDEPPKPSRWRTASRGDGPILPKLAVETAGIEPGSAEIELILDQRDTAVAAWRGWSRMSAVVILVSIAVFLFSIVLDATAPVYDVDGRKSTAMLALRGTSMALGCAGSCVFFCNNMNWRRLKYTFSSTQGLLWMFYTLIFA